MENKANWHYANPIDKKTYVDQIIKLEKNMDKINYQRDEFISEIYKHAKKTKKFIF